MGFKHNRWGIIVGAGLWLAAPAYAVSDAPMIVADAGKSVQTRFMSLDSARGSAAGVRVVRPTQATRSDRAAVQSGFLRIDRSTMAPVRRQAALPKPAAATVAARPSLGRPQDDAVLSLFGESAAPAAAPSFGGRVAGHAWPLPGNVPQRFTSGYGTRKDPFHGRAGFHGGVDIAAAVGTPILASADGVVTKVADGSRYGKYVSIQHRDGTESSYGHMSAQSVRVGQRVRQGQKVGELGSTGRSTGPHLDYRITRNGARFDPMQVLAGKQPSGVTMPMVAAASGATVVRGVRTNAPARVAMRQPLRASVKIIQ